MTCFLLVWVKHFDNRDFSKSFLSYKSLEGCPTIKLINSLPLFIRNDAICLVRHLEPLATVHSFLVE